MKKMLMAFGVVLGLAATAYAITVTVSSQQLLNSGLAATYTSTGLSTSNTYSFNNDGRVFLHFKKTGAGDCTVTITTPGTVQGLAIADVTVSVPATTGDKFVGPFSTSLFNDASQNVSYTLSDTVGLSVALLRL